MRRVAHGFFVVLCLLPLAGCAGMRVEVSIYDKQADNTPFIQASAERKERQVINMRSTGELDRLRDEAVAQVTAALASPAAEQVVEASLLPLLEPAVRQEVEEVFAEANHAFDAGIEYLAQVRRAEPKSVKARRRLVIRAEESFAQGYAAIRSLADRFARLSTAIAKGEPVGSPLSRALRVDAEAPTTRRATAAGTVGALGTLVAGRLEPVERRFDSIVGNAGLFDDIAASTVVTAPEQYWRGTFNEAYGSGHGGNADIAIKMVSLADFSMKGLRLDATKVTPAVFQGVTQAISVAAAAYGVPVGAVRPAGQAATQPAIGDDLLEADRTAAEADRKRTDSRLAALRVMRTILDRRAAITAAQPAAGEANAGAVSAARADAVKQIKAAFGDARGAIQIEQ